MVTPTPTPTPTVTPTPSETPVPFVPASSDTGTLAQTGSDLSIFWFSVGIGLSVAGIILVIAAIVRHRRQA